MFERNNDLERKQLAPGVCITTLDASKFNRCCITLHLRFPAKRESATDAAVLALVPCLAASRDGVRLGRGGGYYDRFLAHYKGAGLLLCPEALLLDELPCDDWDARFAPENILTEKGILR